MAQIIKADFEFDTSAFGIIDADGRIQAAIDNAVMSWCLKYAPWRTGTLAMSPFSASTPGMVTYETPYARRLYYHPEYNFRKDVNPLAGAYWFERMKADHQGDILREALNVAYGRA